MKKTFDLITRLDITTLENLKKENHINYQILYVLEQIKKDLAKGALSKYDPLECANFHLKQVALLEPNHPYLSAHTLKKIALIAELLIDIKHNQYQFQNYAAILTEMYMALDTDLHRRIRTIKKDLFILKQEMITQLIQIGIKVYPDETIAMRDCEIEEINTFENNLFWGYQYLSELLKILDKAIDIHTKIIKIQQYLHWSSQNKAPQIQNNYFKKLQLQIPLQKQADNFFSLFNPALGKTIENPENLYFNFPKFF